MEKLLIDLAFLLNSERSYLDNQKLEFIFPKFTLQELFDLIVRRIGEENVEFFSLGVSQIGFNYFKVPEIPILKDDWEILADQFGRGFLVIESRKFYLPNCFKNLIPEHLKESFKSENLTWIVKENGILKSKIPL